MSSQLSTTENVSLINTNFVKINKRITNICKLLLTKNIKKDAVGLYQVKTFRTDLIKPVIGLMSAPTENEKKLLCSGL